MLISILTVGIMMTNRGKTMVILNCLIFTMSKQIQAIVLSIQTILIIQTIWIMIHIIQNWIYMLMLMFQIMMTLIGEVRMDMMVIQNTVHLMRTVINHILFKLRCDYNEISKSFDATY